MATKRVESKDIIQKGLFEDAVKGAEDLNKVLEEQIKLFKDNLKAQQDIIKGSSLSNSDDLKKFNKALKEVDATYKAVNETQKAQKVVLSDLEKAQQRLKKAQSDEAKQVAEVNVKTQQQNKLNKEAAQVKANLLTLYQKESRTLNELRKKYKDVALTTGINSKESKKLAKEVQVLDKRLKEVDAGAGQFQRKVGNYPKIFSKIGAAFGVAALGLAGLVRGFRNAIKTTNDYEKSNSNLQAVLGVTKAEMASLRVQSQELGSTTAFTASQVAELQVELAKLGFPIDDIKNMTESTLNAAAAMGSGLGETAKLTGATLKAFGLDSTEAARVNDVLAAATSKSALDFEKLSGSMSTIAPVAASFGFSLEGTTSLLGELSNAGFDASSAATATRNILINLADSNGKLAKSLKEPVKDLPSLVRGLKQLEAEGTDLGKAFELTDKRSVAAFSTFIKGTDSVLELNDALEKAGGSAERMAKVQLDNLSGDLKILDSAFEGLVLSVLAGDGAFSKFSRGIVQAGAKLLNLLTITKGASKENENYVDSQLDILNATDKSTKSNQALIDKYESLTKKQKLNNTERKELKSVTDELIATFGVSATSINKETGEINVNIEAIKEKIALEQALNSETVKNLFAEKVRLENQIKIAAQAEDTLQSLRERFGDDSNILSLINAKDANEFNRILAEVRNSLIGNEEGSERFENKLAVLQPQLDRSAKATFNLWQNQVDLAKINQNLLDLGIDADVLADKELKKLTDKIKGTNDLTGLIEKQRSVVSELNKELEKATTEDEIKRLQEAIEFAQIELKRLLDLRFNYVKELERADEDLQKFLRENSQKTADEFKKIQDKEEQEAKERAERLKAIREGVTTSAIEAANTLFNVQSRIAEAEIQQIDRKIAANQRALTIAENLGTEELAFRQQQAAKLEQEREQLAEKQERRAKVQAFFNLFAEFAKSEPNTAAVKALSQSAIANAIVGFFNEGTESVGDDTHAKWRSTGTDDYLAAVHKGERIIPTDLNAKIGDLSNEALADLAYSYQSGGNAPSVIVSQMSDERIVQGLNEVKKSLSNIRIDVNWDSQGRVIEKTVSQGMTKVINHLNSRPRL